MTEWETTMQRKRAVHNLFYAVLFALIGLGTLGALLWLLGKIGGSF